MRDRIAITGGAGSLGRAFVRALKDSHDILVIDNNEWATALIEQEFHGVETKLMDFADYDFQDAPDILIHLAAYKHVNLGENNVSSFIENNVSKTHSLFKKAREMATRILFVSTDKAVEPISVYGFTKALGERLAWEYGGQVARLGNILASSGSVIPVWEEAIKAGQALAVTDEAMERYVIEDSEAVKQILDGFVKKQQLIVPDMGEPVKLLDLLEQVLRRNGYENLASYTPGVRRIGIRPGEKLRERLRWDWE